MKKSLIIGIVVLVAAVVIVFIFWNNQERAVKEDGGQIINYEDLPSEMFYCEQDEDCTLVRTDCTLCSCDVIVVNEIYAEEYRNKICKDGYKMNPICGVECLWAAPKCINNKCGFAA